MSATQTKIRNHKYLPSTRFKSVMLPMRAVSGKSSTYSLLMKNSQFYRDCACQGPGSLVLLSLGRLAYEIS
jgi:hypothetical protein